MQLLQVSPLKLTQKTLVINDINHEQNLKTLFLFDEWNPTKSGAEGMCQWSWVYWISKTMMLGKKIDTLWEDRIILGYSKSFGRASIPDFSTNNQQIS